MYIQFESERADSRVKALSFHSSQPILAVGLHNGHLEIWDIEMQVRLLLDSWTHNGPLRTVDFHPRICHILCSGGDDKVLRVWSIEPGRLLPFPDGTEIAFSENLSRSFIAPQLCISLHGHTDYIRSTQFHQTLPWILSASDDMTIRIWDWSRKACLAVCHGHEHYVMCARFHPNANYILSGSLDFSLRLWDYTALTESVRPFQSVNSSSKGDQFDSISLKIKGKITLQRSVDNAHEKGVNWINIHPTKPLFISASDDRTVRLWNIEYENGIIQEIGCIREHCQSVSCCSFYDENEFASCGEDGEVLLWDIANDRQLSCNLSNKKKRCDLWQKTHRARYWTLVKHSALQYMAAGHDFGFDIFCLSTLFPVCHYTIERENLIYCENKEIKKLCFAHNRNSSHSEAIVLKKFKRKSEYTVPKSINVSSDGKCAFYEFSSLVDQNQPTFYALHRFQPPESTQAADKFVLISDCIGMPGFISYDHFAHIDGSQAIVFKNFDGEVIRKLSRNELEEMLRSIHGTSLIVRSMNRLYSISSGHMVAECTTSHGLLCFSMEYPADHILATRIFEDDKEKPENIIWDIQQTGTYLSIVSREKITICHLNFVTICAFCSRESIIDSVSFDSGNFMQSAGIDETNRAILFTAGNQLLCGIIPSGKVETILTFPSRIKILHGNINEGQFLYSIPLGDQKISATKIADGIENSQISDRIFRCAGDMSIVKLQILSDLSPKENTLLFDELTSRICRMSVPFSYVKRIVESAIPKKNSLRLLHTIDERSQCNLEVQLWLFDLGCKFFDVQFAYDRLSKAETILKLCNNKPTNKTMEDHWSELAECAMWVGDFPLAEKCYQMLPSSSISLQNSAIFRLKKTENSKENQEERFKHVLYDLMAGKVEDASDTLKSIGMSSLTEKYKENVPCPPSGAISMDWPMPSKNMCCTIRLGNYFTPHEDASIPVLVENDASVIHENQYLTIERTETESSHSSDPRDFIFDSSENE